MTFNTIGSSSKGNCYLIDYLMIDVGLPYKDIKEYIHYVNFVLLSHIHGDHFNKTTMRKIVVNHPHITIVCGAFLLDELLNMGICEDRILVVEVGKVYDLDGFKISPVKAYHDVDNFGYRIMKDHHKHLHITDTSTLEGIQAQNYDTATIECNHDEIRALELIEEAKENDTFSHLTGAMNSHLSVQQTIEFCEKNNILELMPAHIGNSTKEEVLEILRVWNENHL